MFVWLLCFVVDKVDVGAFLAGVSVLGTVPTLCQTVEGAHPVAPTMVDGNGHLGDVAADNLEHIVGRLERSEDVGCPQLGQAGVAHNHEVDDAVAAENGMVHEVYLFAYMVGLFIDGDFELAFVEVDGVEDFVAWI